MARKPEVTDSHTDTMGVLGQSASKSTVYSVLSARPGHNPAGAEASVQCPQLLHECEVSSWLERPRPCPCRRSIKRARSDEELQLNTSSPKRFISEDIVATHLQQLHLATSNPTPPPSPSLISSTTMPQSQPLTTDRLLPSFSPSLLSVPLLSSSDCSSLLASVARSHPLSMKTVASCPQSLETAREGMMWEEEEDQTTMADSSSLTTESSSSNRTYPLAATGTSLSSQFGSQISPSIVRTLNGNNVYQQRTSPTHKRPVSALDDDIDDLEEIACDAGSGVGGECWRREGGASLLLGPKSKRSKVDLSCRVTTDTIDSMNFDPISVDTQLSRVTLDDSEPPSKCSCLTTPITTLITNSRGSGVKKWERVVPEDGSDSSDGVVELAPEKPLSLWLSPELRAISDSCSSRRAQELLLPPSILERYHKPKGMELVPWVGGPAVMAKVEEKTSGSYSSDNTQMESLIDDKELDQQREGGVPHKWPRDEENHNDHDVSMEP